MLFTRIALLSIGIVCFVSCRHTINAASVIHEGRGVDDISFGRANRDFLKHYFSRPYDSVLHNGYSVAIVYPRFGASFYYLQKDDSARIFAMGFDSAFNGLTSRGFDMHHMLVGDMIHIYGEPRWQMLESVHTLYAHYDSAGIYFAIRPKSEPPPNFYGPMKYNDEAANAFIGRSPNVYYDTAYARSRIVEITIGVPATAY